ncbi:MAG: leucyl aminopeptidase [Tissierellia bacterium]|nr:leucyl aminopeptidase [Tissierellia bacterium]
MKLSIQTFDDVIVRFISSDEEVQCPHMKKVMENHIFNGNEQEVYISTSEAHGIHVIVGLGKTEELSLDSLKVAGLAAGKALQKMKKSKATLRFTKDLGDICAKEKALSLAEGVLNATYAFDKYKKEKFENHLEEIGFDPDCVGDLKEEDLQELLHKWEGIIWTRDLVNIPAMDMYPEVMAKEAKKLEELGVTVKIFDKKQIEEMGMEAYLSVARGSDKEPRFIVMEYMKGEGDPIVLVGKGVTYDSGGYSIKPSDGMKTMKCDMGGGATVMGAMKAIALAGLKKNVVAISAACENLIDGDAYKPGDVIGSLKGLTIEVDNTDAEGRLTLADAVCYGERTYKPKVLVDLATLTGACLVALGEHRAGVLGNCDGCVKFFLQCAEEEGEKAWELPATKDFKELNKSDIADIKNTGGRFGGSSSAGCFVGTFIDDCAWVHVDIAGPAFNSRPYLYQPQGGTGHMVKTLFNFVKNKK